MNAKGKSETMIVTRTTCAVGRGDVIAAPLKYPGYDLVGSLNGAVSFSTKRTGTRRSVPTLSRRSLAEMLERSSVSL